VTGNRPSGSDPGGLQYSILADRGRSDEQVEQAMIDEIDRVLDHPDRLELPVGALITEEGAPLDGIAILLDGQVKLFREVDGHEIVFHHRTAGRIIGLLALARARPASFSTTAETAVTLLPLSLQDLDLALLRSPSLAMLFSSALVRSLARRSLKHIEQQLEIREFAKSRIEASERLAIVGQLAAGVAHELNNPLQGVVGYSHLLLERIAEDDPNRDFVEKIITQADRCREIIRALLDYSRPHKPRKQPVDVNALLRESLTLLEDQALFINIEIITNFDAALPLVIVDPSQIQQVLINVIINAAEAMEGVGLLVLTTRTDHSAEAIEVEVRDTGPGIPEKNLGQVFDPFFSTKEVMHGTGLGLAISHGIVRRHQGTISVASDPDIGTAFSLHLPIKADWPLESDDGCA